jgi:endonuclease/exonuclease/phosphatase family metal-dependent hydrolase
MAEAAKVELLTEVFKRPDDLKDVDEFRIATYNVHNLFGDEPDVYSSRPSPPASDEQLRALGQMICGLDADVIAFAEVQNELILKQLFREHVNRKLAERGDDQFTTFVCVPARDPRGINVALATRLAVRGTVTFHDYEFGSEAKPVRFSRDLLGVEVFVTKRYSFLFFVAHLKSKLGGESAEKKREIEATEIRELFEQPVFGGKPYIEQDLILAGDMNDDPDTAVIEILRGEDGSKPLRDILADLDPNYTFPTHNRYNRTRLDYLFASPSMLEEVALNERKIHREEPAAVASDHFPASVAIRVRAT